MIQAKLHKLEQQRFKLKVKLELSVSKDKMQIMSYCTDITFKKKITTENGIINHGGLEIEFGSKC